jgi:hypothetical protein
MCLYSDFQKAPKQPVFGIFSKNPFLKNLLTKANNTANFSIGTRASAYTGN